MARRVALVLFAVAGGWLPAQEQPPLRWLDLAADTSRQSTVHRVARKYQGHPTTVQLPDGAILCVHPEGHGQGAIVLQRSGDGGRTWSAPLPVPENWATSKETPTIHRLIDAKGQARLVLFSGLHPIRRSVSRDDGRTWTPLEPIGEYGGIVAMASVVALRDGRHAAWFHDDGRYFRKDGKRSQFTVYQTLSEDGGDTWGTPSVVWTGADLDLCEPGVVRSPDGRRLAMLLRENSRRQGSQVLFSDDEGLHWSAPRPLPTSLCGDRHVGAYAPDGRLCVSFRDVQPGSPTQGDWLLWVGSFADLEHGRAGQYRVRLSRNYHAWDCGYPGVEVLEDGTLLLVTYGHWEPGEAPFVRAVRVTMAELDALAQGPAPDFVREPGTVRPTERIEPWWVKRVAEDLAAAQAGGHRLVLIGDSITQGWRDTGAEPWAATWQPRGALNLGVSGDRTQNVLWRLDHGLLDALAQPNNDVRAAVVMIGTNNSNRDECTAEAIAAGVVEVVRRLRRGLPRAKVVLLAIFPRGERPDAQRQKNARASELAAAAFAGDEFVVCRDLGRHFTRADGSIDKAVMGDFLHLSASGYRTWSEVLWPEVAPLLQ